MRHRIALRGLPLVASSLRALLARRCTGPPLPSLAECAALGKGLSSRQTRLPEAGAKGGSSTWHRRAPVGGSGLLNSIAYTRGISLYKNHPLHIMNTDVEATEGVGHT